LRDTSLLGEAVSFVAAVQNAARVWLMVPNCCRVKNSDEDWYRSSRGEVCEVCQEVQQEHKHKSVG
jgi:hypothetical protein